MLSYNVVRYRILSGCVIVDAQSYLAACAPWYSRLCRFAYRYTRRRPSAERVVRAALVRLWRERSGSELDSTNLEEMLHAAVRAEAISRLQEKVVAQRDVEAAFQVAMDDLPSRTRGVLRDRLVGGLSLSEIAAGLTNGRSPRAN